MVSLDHLAALDLLLWLGTTERAAALAGTNQSTISRRSRMVLEAFELRLGRSADGWWPSGDTSLLALERQVHQRARFLGRSPLRLQAPDWSRQQALRRLPEGWCVNPARPGIVCDDPVALLRARVIDACLLTPTQLPERTDDLRLFDLYRRPIELTVLEGGASPACRRSSASSRLQLDLLPFLPRSCRVRSSAWFETLTGGLQQEAAWSQALRDRSPANAGVCVAFLTPEMREIQERPWWVVDAVEPYPYVERLAVLAEHAQAPVLQQLRERLLGQFAPLAA